LYGRRLDADAAVSQIVYLVFQTIIYKTGKRVFRNKGSERIESISLPERASDWPSDGAAPLRLADEFPVRMRDPSS